MPAHGEQYRDTPATINPFINNAPHVTEYTAQEIATLQSRLDKQLGPEYISTRPGNGGGKVHYLAAEKVINLANEVFGFNGWSSAIQNVQIDFVDENPSSGRINLGLSTIMRVTLRDGTFHEDIGYGHCENIKGKAAAFEKAKKEAATDALKRALRNFGNVLGNCLYDKEYLQKVTKVKVQSSRWDAEKLHRHPDFAPIKQEAVVDNAPARAQPNNARLPVLPSAASASSAEFEEDFGANIFDESDFDHPDHVALGETVQKQSLAPDRVTVAHNQASKSHPGPARTHTIPAMRPQPNAQAPQGAANHQHHSNFMNSSTTGSTSSSRIQGPQTPGLQQRQHQNGSAQPQPTVDNRSAHLQSPHPFVEMDDSPRRQSGAQNGDPEPPLPRPAPDDFLEGFVMGSKVDLLRRPEARPPNASIKFNPHAESPSIRRTYGINPGKSAPVSRMQIQASQTSPAPPPQNATAGPQPPPPPPTTTTGITPPNAPKPSESNYINPSADVHRKIGMPQSGPLGPTNRASYRPPSAVKRTAMSDVTNLPHVDGASDPKKAKIGKEDESTENAPPAAT